ncbi:MAG: DUF4886 domain-containing protein [Cellvibrionaceae bacterium]
MRATNTAINFRLLGFILFILFSISRSTDAIEDNTSPERILFIGNSYLYYNDSLHNHVRRIAIAAHSHDKQKKLKKLKYRSITISGGRIKQHPFEHYLVDNAIGYKEPFDIVILQGHSTSAIKEKSRQKFIDAVTRAHKVIQQHGAKTALYMTHAYAKGHKQYDEHYIDKLEKLYVDTAKKIDAIVLPVGLAFKKSLTQRPELALHKAHDHTHPNLLGTYLAACVVYSTLYQQACSGIDYDYFGNINKETVLFLQRVADETVAQFFAQNRSLNNSK